MSDRMKALCCTCGAIRTCSRPRNHRAENYWFNGPIDLDWNRETGDLKCAECGRITTHALIHPEGWQLRDHAEMMQRVATGNSHGHFSTPQIEDVRRKYNQGMPLNPELHHLWWVEAAKEDWSAGRRTTTSLCGRKVEIPRDPNGPSAGSERAKKADDWQAKPREVRDQEYEDPETGLSWRTSDCVDCHRVWHLELLSQRRGVLTKKMAAFLVELTADKEGGYPKKIGLQTVNALIAAFESAAKETSPADKKDADR